MVCAALSGRQSRNGAQRIVREMRWPDGFVCPACGHEKGWALRRKAHTFECAGCRRQTSVTAGTILHASKLPLTVWFWAAYLMATHSNGISALQLQKQLGIGSYRSAWLLAHKLRASMVDPERNSLSGLVEIDEASLPFRTKDFRARPARRGASGKRRDARCRPDSAALRVAPRRPPAASRGSTVFPDTLFGPLLADRTPGCDAGRDLGEKCGLDRDVSRPMQDAPDVDVRFPLHIEDRIRKPSDRLKAQAGNIQLMRMVGRAARRPFANLPEGVFQRVDKARRNRRFRPRQIVLDYLIDIAPRPLAKNDRLAAHRRPASRTRPRSRSK